MTITAPADIFGPSDVSSWRHGDWQDGRLELTPVGPDLRPSVLFQGPKGVLLCPKDGMSGCHPFRRRTPES